MQKILMLTLGFDERFAYRAILRHDVREGDMIFLITGKITDKVEKAHKMVKEFISKSYGESVNVKVVELDPTDLIGSIGRLVAIISSMGDSRFVVNLSGGMRVVIVSTLLAFLLLRMRNVKVEIELEDLSGVVEVPESLMALITSHLPRGGVEILKVAAQGQVTAKDLSRTLSKDRSTIRKQIKRLVNLGLLRIKKRKPLTIELTDLGRLLMRMPSIVT